MRKIFYLYITQLCFLFIIIAGFKSVSAQTVIIDDDLQGSTIGNQVGGAFTDGGYKPGLDNSGGNHISYIVPSQVSNGYIQFEIKGFYPNDIPNDGEHSGFFIMYDGRGIGNNPTWDTYRDNYFRWNLTYRKGYSFKAVTNCAAPTPLRLNSTYAVFIEDINADGVFNKSDYDYQSEQSGPAYSDWDAGKTRWYTIKVEWNEKEFKAYIDGILINENEIPGLYDYNPVDFRIWLGGALMPGSTRYTIKVPDLVYRNFKLVSYGESADSAPTIVSTPVTTGTVGQLYSYDVDATGSPAPAYSLTTYPSGMTINSTYGEIAWTPSSAGDYNVTVKVSNGIAPDATQSFSINVTEGSENTAPIITSTPVTSGIVGQLYSYDVDATGNPAPAYSLTTYPDGMTINSTNGEIEWTPGSTGNYDVTVKVENGINPDATQSFTINVNEIMTAPTDLLAVLSIPDTQVVKLSWKDNSSNELGFIIERKLGDVLSTEPFVKIDTVSADVSFYEDQTVEDTTTYTYRICAFNANTTSNYSNSSQIETPLPVELVSFNALVAGGQVRLVWETATELNNAGFTIQRQKDVEGFIDIAFIKGKGTSTSKSTYSFSDKSALSGIYQYRLKSIDFDGSTHYSEIVTADLGIVSEFRLEQNYPNPFNPSTKIRFAVPVFTKLTLNIYNQLGEVVAQPVDKYYDPGSYEVEVNMSNLASGIYLYKITTGNISLTKKMMLLR